MHFGRQQSNVMICNTYIQVRQAEIDTSHKFLSSQIWADRQQNKMLTIPGKLILSL